MNANANRWFLLLPLSLLLVPFALLGLTLAGVPGFTAFLIVFGGAAILGWVGILVYAFRSPTLSNSFKYGLLWSGLGFLVLCGAVVGAGLAPASGVSIVVALAGLASAVAFKLLGHRLLRQAARQSAAHAAANQDQTHQMGKN